MAKPMTVERSHVIAYKTLGAKYAATKAVEELEIRLAS